MNLGLARNWLLVTALILNAIRLGAAFAMADGGKDPSLLLATMGGLTALVVSGAIGILTYADHEGEGGDPYRGAIIAALLAGSTVLMSASHLSLMHDGAALHVVLHPTWLRYRLPSVVVALAAALLIELSILGLVRLGTQGSGDTRPGDLPGYLADEIEVRRALAGAQRVEPQVPAETFEKKCPHCVGIDGGDWVSRPHPTEEKAHRQWTGHLAHCKGLAAEKEKERSNGA